MWNFQDVWILLSSNGNLPSLIASADHINVSIPTRDEIEQSARRLIAAGLIAPDRGGLKQTRHGRSLVRLASKGTRGIRDVPPKLEAILLDTVPYPSVVSDWSLTQDEWAVAYEQYRELHRRRRS